MNMFSKKAKNKRLLGLLLIFSVVMTIVPTSAMDMLEDTTIVTTCTDAKNGAWQKAIALISQGFAVVQYAHAAGQSIWVARGLKYAAAGILSAVHVFNFKYTNCNPDDPGAALNENKYWDEDEGEWKEMPDSTSTTTLDITWDFLITMGIVVIIAGIIFIAFARGGGGGSGTSCDPIRWITGAPVLTC